MTVDFLPFENDIISHQVGDDSINKLKFPALQSACSGQGAARLFIARAVHCKLVRTFSP